MDEGHVKREDNPNETANLFSKIFFIWTQKIFRRGLQKTPMSSDELYKPLSTDTSQILGDRLEENWMAELEKAKLRGRPPRLLYAVIKTFAWEYGFKWGVIHGINDLIFRLGQPLLLGALLSFFQAGSGMDLKTATEVAGVMTGIMFLTTIFQNHCGLAGFHMGMKIRVACCSLIYRKALRLSRTALGETAPGQIVNLLSNDVSRFDIVVFFLHYMWSAPVGAIFVTYLIWTEAGISGLIGMLAVFIVIPLQAYLGKLTSRFRLQTAYKTDERVRLMDEIVGGIQVIKMYAWEKPFAKLVSTARVKELKILKKSSYVRGIYMTFNLFNLRVAMFATMLSLSLMGEPLRADKIFVFASYFSMISFTFSGAFVRGFGEIAETLVSFQRLTKFLLLDEHTESSSNRKDSDKDTSEVGYVQFENVTARWNPESIEPTLNKVSIHIKPLTLTAIVGPVGGGKSSLLQAMLGELTHTEGNINIPGKVSYSGQEPWVFAASVRQNITFGLPYNRIRYAEVIRVCALKSDIAQWPQGDKTVVGERGTSLSGGQRARINLARAVYMDADVYLLDDPLSAVDTHVGKHLFDECINGFLRDKTRILVTHQLQYLEEADSLVLINNGAVQIQGKFKELQESDGEFAQLLAKVQEEDSKKTEPEPEDEKLSPRERLLRNSSVTSSRSSRSSRTLDLESVEDLTAVPMEDVKKPSGSVLFRYFLSGTNVVVLFILSCFFILAQVAASLSDFWVSIWTTQDTFKFLVQAESIRNNTEDSMNSTEPNNSTSYVYDGFLDPRNLSTELCQYIHSGLIVSLFILAISRSIMFYEVAINCSQCLHDNMFKRVSQTALAFFFDNPSGRILNRFSKDLGSIDELLPKALLDSGQIIITVLGGIIVTLTINYIFLIPVAVVTVFALLARVVFLRASRNIKRIEGVTRSPVFTHLNATLQGLTTIRAYNAQEILKREFDNHQNLHTSAWFLFISASQAFGFALDILCFLLIACVTFILLLIDTGLADGQVGLAITQTMALSGMVQWGMRQSAEVSNQLTSVERVVEYTDLESETNLESGPLEKESPKLLDSWPRQGKIEFKNLFFYYKENIAPAIKDLSVHIQSGEKVGIIGRTGAGKSSIIAALFRLGKIEGTISIDDIDTSQVSLQFLRSKISIIPQEPVLFTGTIRRNLDPFQMFRDSDLWQALEEVELKDALTYGLDTPVQEGGSNFSVGQKQLLCLARAILRNNKVLLLDEATASVDPHTDSLIQKTIRVKFRDCTVCTIAHRLNTIMDSDKVLVMDFGKMVEFDTPYNLLQKENGFFTKMVDQTGPAMSEQLKKIAEECRKS